MELVLLQPESWIGLIYLSLSRFIYIDIYSRYKTTRLPDRQVDGNSYLQYGQLRRKIPV